MAQGAIVSYALCLTVCWYWIDGIEFFWDRYRKEAVVGNHSGCNGNSALYLTFFGCYTCCVGGFDSTWSLVRCCGIDFVYAHTVD